MRRRGWIRSGGGGVDGTRLERLESAVDQLREAAEYGTVVVEGARDLAALEWMGVGGLHYVINQGRPFDAILEDLAQSPAPVVLLVDWDRTGGRLLKRLEDNLKARVAVDVLCRRRLAVVCQTRCLEEVPAELSALRGQAR
ncbi:MAG: hypothetical protein V4510_00160 [bacterium]